VARAALVAGLTAAGITLVAVRPAGAATLLTEDFRGASTPSGVWSEVSTRGDHQPCLTAATTAAPGSLKPCRAGAGDKPGDGAFQLTNNTPGQGGVLLLNKPISATAGLHIAFDMFQYGSSTGTGADGISFFFLDGGQETVQPGAPGGGLGYQGMPGALAGVGFDAHGDFSAKAAGGSGPGAQPDHVVLRGAASTHWRYLTAAKSPVSLAVAQAKTREAARRTVNIDLSTENVLKVHIDFHDGKGMRSILHDVPLNDLPGQPQLPPTVKLGFAAATGTNTDFHEIRDLSIGVLDPELVTTVSSDATFHPGTTGVFDVSVGNDASAGPTSAPVTATVPVPDGVTVQSADGDGWACRVHAGQILCTRPGSDADALPPGQTYPPIEVTVAVPADASDSSVIQAQVNTPNNHKPGGGASDPVTVPIESARARR
jgi:hypothetical protein